MKNNTDGRCGGTILSYDEACLSVETNHPMDFYQQISACIGCSLDFFGQVDGHRDFVVNSLYTTTFTVGSCKYEYDFEEAGQYLVNLTTNDDCTPIEVTSPPDYPYGSFVTLISFALVLIAFSLKKYFCERPTNFEVVINDLGDVSSDSNASSESNGQGDTERLVDSPPRIERLMALDMFRGITIFLMIIVNAGGGGYWFLQHSNWDGVTLADLVFPWFTWIMGMSILSSVGKNLRQSRSRLTVMKEVIIRSIIIIFLGIVVSSQNGPVNFSHIRIPGVLQRLGVTYFIVATVQVLVTDRVGFGFVLVQILFSWSSFISHIAITNYLPVPGCPTGYVGPGGLSDGGQFLNCTGGAAGYIDQIIFTKKHLYSSGPWSSLYSTRVPYDPEGLLGSLTMCTLVFSGVIDRYFFSQFRTKYIATYFFTVGLINMLIGFSFSKFTLVLQGSDWLPGSLMIPINKPLWSPSFILIALGTAQLVFCFLVVVVHRFYWRGWYFSALGRNSLLIYLGSVLLGNLLPFSWSPITHGSHLEPLMQAIWGAWIWSIIAYILHKKGCYLVA